MRAVLIYLLLSFPVSLYAGDIDAGKKIYTQICSHCHRVNYDAKFGPGLAGVTERRDVAWLNVFLQNPNKMIKKDEYAQTLRENNAYNLTMPTLPAMQDEQKRADVISYLETLK